MKNCPRRADRNGSNLCSQLSQQIENLITAPYNWRQKTLTRLLVERGVFSKEEFLGMVRVVDKEMKKRKRSD